jgi:hypothetical protein
MHSAGVGKMRRSFASLKMTGWMDAMDSGDPTPENTLQVQDRDPFHNIRERFEHAVDRVCEGTTQAMHYRGSSEGRAFC